MPQLKIDDQISLYYEEHGEGTPILFIHGVLMSSRFFQKQTEALSQNHRVILLDMRGHGQSSAVQEGHTIAGYAQDVKRVIELLDLQDVVLAGWSMGCFVVWDYVNQFGTERLKGTILIEESASDFAWDGWEHGPFDMPALVDLMQVVQTDKQSFYTGFILQMFKEVPAEADAAWMLEEMMKVPSAIAATILFNQSVVDYRETVGNIDVPTLIIFGEDDKFFKVSAGEYIADRIEQSTLVIFADSSHCPFLEEPEAFNHQVDSFVASL